MKVRTCLIGLLVVCGIGVCSISTAAAQPAGPPAGYNINPEFTEKSPDGAITIEQYVNKETDDWKWQFWARHQDKLTMLKPEQPDYPAGFRFTNDSQWLVRMQKTGSGESTGHQHRRDQAADRCDRGLRPTQTLAPRTNVPLKPF